MKKILASILAIIFVLMEIVGVWFSGVFAYYMIADPIMMKASWLLVWAAVSTLLTIGLMEALTKN